MKTKVIETVNLENSKDYKVVYREHDSGMISLELDLATLSDLGINISKDGNRRNKNFRLSIMDTNFEWRQNYDN